MEQRSCALLFLLYTLAAAGFWPRPGLYQTLGPLDVAGFKQTNLSVVNISYTPSLLLNSLADSSDFAAVVYTQGFIRAEPLPTLEVSSFSVLCTNKKKQQVGLNDLASALLLHFAF